jgi:hypothetical protein
MGKKNFSFLNKNFIIISILIIILTIILVFIKPKDPREESQLNNVPPEIQELDKKQQMSFKKRNTRNKFYNDKIDDKHVLAVYPLENNDILVVLDDYDKQDIVTKRIKKN